MLTVDTCYGSRPIGFVNEIDDTDMYAKLANDLLLMRLNRPLSQFVVFFSRFVCTNLPFPKFTLN